MTPIPLLGLLFASQVPPDFIPVDWRSLPTRRIQGPSTIAARAAAPATKVLKLLVVPMRYADQDSTYSSDTLSRVFSGPYPYVTVNQYFAEQSNGQFQVEARVLPWQKLSLTRSQALALDERSRQRRFRNEAAAAASRSEVNFADYDFNGDKIVDGLMIMYAGKSSQEEKVPGAMGNVLVTHFSLNDTLIDEYRVRQNVFISEVRNDRPSTPGPIAHELCHVIGASDTYDTDDTANGKSGGLGYWDLMSSGSHGLMYDPANPERKGSFKPTGMSTWVKDDLGFIDAPWIDSTREIRLKPGAAVKVWTDPYRLRQFLYLENRDRSGVDSILPGPGLFVTRVRTSQTLELSNGVAHAVNENPLNLGVEILEASGEQRIGRKGEYLPLQKDLFAVSVDSLTDEGPVSLRNLDGNPSGASLRNIRMDGSDVVLTVTASPLRGYALTSRTGRVQSMLSNIANTQFLYGFPAPTSGKLVGARLALSQGAGPSTLRIWKTYSAWQQAGTPLFSMALNASHSSGPAYYWASLETPIEVIQGDTIYVSQSLGADSASRLYVRNVDALPTNSPCWITSPGKNPTKDRINCPVIDLMIEHEGGSSMARPVQPTRELVARTSRNRLVVTGALAHESIQAKIRGIDGRIHWSGILLCDANGSGQLALYHARGLRILEVRSQSGSRILTDFVP